MTELIDNDLWRTDRHGRARLLIVACRVVRSISIDPSKTFRAERNHRNGRRSISAARTSARSPTRGRPHRPMLRRVACTIRAEGDAVYAVAGPAQGQNFAPADRVPDPDGLVGTGGGDSGSIGTECHSHHPVGVALETCESSARSRHPSSEWSGRPRRKPIACHPG